MSIHYVPDDVEGFDLLAVVGNHSLRQVKEPGRTAWHIEPDLNPQEAARFDELVADARARIRFTPAEMDALRPDIAGLRTYLALDPPTAAQTVAATKAIIRVLRAIFRD
jgi:hypothetical protein